jgi:magnesium transporter
MRIRTTGRPSSSSAIPTEPRFGIDPAFASSPFVGTIVNLTGIVIFFSIAGAILPG